jgi:hemolysin D
MGNGGDGQPVALKLEAFPFTRHGTILGEVKMISSDAIEDEKLGLVYFPRIKLTKRQMNRGQVAQVIALGMLATADVKTGNR